MGWSSAHCLFAQCLGTPVIAKTGQEVCHKVGRAILTATITIYGSPSTETTNQNGNPTSVDRVPRHGEVGGLVGRVHCGRGIETFIFLIP